jgi:hypothetical protein
VKARLAVCALLVVAAGWAGAAETILLPRTVPSFNQTYTVGTDAWGDAVLGTGGCPDLIRATGCLITAFSAVFAYYDIALAIPAPYSSTGAAQEGMNPRILNDWLRARRGYGQCASDPLGSCCLEWTELPRGISLSFHSNRSTTGLNAIAGLIIDHALRRGDPVVAGVHWSATCRSGSSQSEDCHWVVLTGKAGAAYTIMDPYNPDHTSRFGLRTTLDKGSRGAYVIDRFVIVSRVPGDPTSENALAAPPAPPAPQTPPVEAPAPQKQSSPLATLAFLLVALSIVAAAVFLAPGAEP